MRCLIAFVLLAVSSLLTAQTYPVCGPARNSYNFTPPAPIGFWKMCGDTSSTSGCVASSSTVVYDSGSLANNGAQTGTAAGTSFYYSTGYSEAYAGYFNGTNDSIVVPESSSYNVSSLTVTAWINTSTTSGTPTMVCRDNLSSSREFQFRLSSGVPQAILFISGTTKSLTATASVATGTWTHVALVWTGTTAYLYANGVQVAAAAYSGSLSAGTGDGIRIGSCAGSYLFTGLINNVRIYNAALSGVQIAALYSSGQ